MLRDYYTCYVYSTIESHLFVLLIGFTLYSVLFHFYLNYRALQVYTDLSPGITHKNLKRKYIKAWHSGDRVHWATHVHDIAAQTDSGLHSLQIQNKCLRRYTLHSKREYHVLYTKSALLMGVPWQIHTVFLLVMIRNITTHSSCKSFRKYGSNTFRMRPSTETQGHCLEKYV